MQYILKILKLCSMAHAVAIGMMLLLRGRHRRHAAAFGALVVDPVIQCFGGRLTFLLLVTNEGLLSILAAAVICWHVCESVLLTLFGYM